MSWLVPSAIATMSGTLVLALVYAYLYMQNRERSLGVWSIGWFIYALRFVADILMASGNASPGLLILNQLFALASGLLLLWGTYIFTEKEIPSRWFYVSALGAAWIVVGVLAHFPFLLLTLPTFAFLGVIYIWTGVAFLRCMRSQGIGNKVTGWAFVIWGVHKIDYPLLRTVLWFAPWGFFLGALLEIIVAVGILLVYLQDAKDRLSASEERFKQLAENARDVIYRYRLVPESGFEYISPSIKVTGHTPEDFYADPDLIFNLVHPEDRYLIENALTLKNVDDEPIMLRLRKKDGSMIWTEQTIAHVFDDFGTLIAIEGIVRDITDRERAEAESTFKSGLLDNANDSVFVHDFEGNILYINEAAYNTRGYTKEELLSITIEAINTPESAKHVRDRFAEIKKNGSDIIEAVHIMKNGTALPVEIHSSIANYNGTDVIVGIARDITDRKKAEQAQLEAKERMEQLYRVIPSAIFTVDSDGIVTSFNNKAEEITGYAVEEVIGKQCTTFSLNPCIDKCGLFALKPTRPITGKECTIKRKDGEVRVISKNLDLFRDLNGNILGGVESFDDITERKLAEEALKESERRFREMLENIKLTAVMLDTKGTVTFCNDFLLNLTGWQWQEVIGKNWFDVFVPSDIRDEVQKRFFDTTADAKSLLNAEYDIVTRNGERRSITFSRAILRGANGEIIGMASIGEDVTERKRAEEQINYLAYYDSLTNLPNRSLLNDRLTLAIAHAHRNKEMLALMYLDLDSFKNINDTLGLETGDQLLKGVAERLTKCLREGDTVARLGGDEFVLLLPQLSHEDDLAKVAEKVIEHLKPPFNFDNQDLHITTSIGISIYPYDGEDAQTLLKNAEVALYRAKDQGRDNYQLYTASMNAKAFERLALENSLRKALEREEFVLHYQPQVEIETGHIVGVEALLRWEHPDLGLVPPAQFIPLAEETSLIIPIGEWVLRKACEQNKAWQRDGYLQARISVNISARQFRQYELSETVNRVLRDTQLDPEYLELEITESALMQDADKAIAMLKELKRQGIQVSIDDFGTGYSSLGYLKRFPIDRVKIDKLFVNTLNSDKNDAAIITAIIAMSHNLNLKTVAEGVEVVDQLDFLRALDCDEMQGYLFSRPLPAEEIVKLFKNPPQVLRSYWVKSSVQIA